MKNLLVYISPDRKFSTECETLVKIQIDNSFDLGWKVEDILLITNYEYEYNGIKAIVVGDEHFCAVRPKSINTSIIPHLVDIGIVKPGELYWVHDFDAYQMNLIDENELELDSVDLGLTDYGWKPRWCMGSYFFKESSKDIFIEVNRLIYMGYEDETVMMKIEKWNTNNFAERHKRLNITYNFGMRGVEDNYQQAIKPLRVVHFHPHFKRVPTWDIFALGRNGLGMPIINERLMKIFNHHGIQ
jgi:hypothetical protein